MPLARYVFSGRLEEACRFLCRLLDCGGLDMRAAIAEVRPVTRLLLVLLILTTRLQVQTTLDISPPPPPAHPFDYDFSELVFL